MNLTSSFAMLEPFMSFFQMMTVINFGLMFVDRKSGIIRLQDMLYDYAHEKAKPVLDHAGKLTQRCRGDRKCLTDRDRHIMALAETIRSEKRAFANKTEEERVSIFLPSLGFMSGIVGLCFLLLVPAYSACGDMRFLHALEYLSEAAFVSFLATVATLFTRNAFPNRVSVFLVGLLWFFLPLILITVLWVFGLTIICFPIVAYLLFFIFLQFVPSLFLLVRFVCVFLKRRRRIRRIKNYSDELEKLLSERN